MARGEAARLAASEHNLAGMASTSAYDLVARDPSAKFLSPHAGGMRGSGSSAAMISPSNSVAGLSSRAPSADDLGLSIGRPSRPTSVGSASHSELPMLEEAGGDFPEVEPDLTRARTNGTDTHSLLVLENLIILAVEYRDAILRVQAVVGSALRRQFEWHKQLRFFYIHNVVEVHHLLTSVDFGHEFLAGTERVMVMTPSVARSFSSLVSGVSQAQGVVLCGPSGVGKTELVRAAASTLNRLCVIFNCSPTLSASTVESLLLGAALCDVWLCFDDLNRASLGALSLISQQIINLRNDLLINSRQAYAGALGGSDSAAAGTAPDPGRNAAPVRLRPPVLLATAAPSFYPGRVELPQSLAAIFRPIALAVPDRHVIVEVALYAGGFEQSRVLAAKMVGLFELGEAYLPGGAHYGFGLADLLTVVDVMKAHRPSFGTSGSDEALLCAAVVHELYDVKMVPAHAAIFRELIDRMLVPIELDGSGLRKSLSAVAIASRASDPGLTPNFADAIYASSSDSETSGGADGGMWLSGGFLLSSADLIAQREGAVEASLRQLVHESGYADGARLVSHALDLYRLLLTRRGCMLLGSPGTGKTTVHKLLGDVLQAKVNVVSTGAIPTKWLFGHRTATKEWEEGVVSAIFKRMAAAERAARGDGDRGAEAGGGDVGGGSVAPPEAAAGGDDVPPTPAPHRRPTTGETAGPQTGSGRTPHPPAETGGEKPAPRSPTEDPVWIVFDGPIRSEWAESLNSALDTTGTLCLDSGERIRLPPNLRFIFEVDDISGVSPSVVNRLGVVYLSDEKSGVSAAPWRSRITAWIDMVAEVYESRYEEVAGDVVPTLTARLLADGLVPFMSGPLGPDSLTDYLECMLASVELPVQPAQVGRERGWGVFLRAVVLL